MLIDKINDNIFIESVGKFSNRTSGQIGATL